MLVFAHPVAARQQTIRQGLAYNKEGTLLLYHSEPQISTLRFLPGQITNFAFITLSLVKSLW